MKMMIIKNMSDLVFFRIPNSTILIVFGRRLFPFHHSPIPPQGVASMEISIDIHGSRHLFFQLLSLLYLILHDFGLLFLFCLSPLIKKSPFLDLHRSALTTSKTIESLLYLLTSLPFQLELFSKRSFIVFIEQYVLQVYFINPVNYFFIFQ